MTTRSGPVRAWYAWVWRWVLQALKAMGGLDRTGQFSGWTLAYAVVPPGWVNFMQWADELRGVLTEATQQVVTERLPVVAPADQAPVHVTRDRHQADLRPFTARELAHLHFVRWLHQTGRVIC